MEVKEQDKKFLSALERVYKAVSKAPASLPPLEARRICTARIREAFSMADIQIKGSEYLPYQKNSIFIYNHLNNHAYYTEDEGFQITLDSHFISSMILDKYYKDSGTCVVRHSLPEEDNHRTYYKRLNYIRVYAKNFLPKGLDPNVVKSVIKEFYIKALKHLSQGSGLVFSPEGYSCETRDSPGAFRYGIFKLAACMSPQPLIVPLVMANFDKLVSQDTYKCEIKQPFKMRDLGITDKNDAALPKVVANLNHQYKQWVSDLLIEEMDFKSEISKLEKQIKNIKTSDDLVVFYGSSTIRLWNSLQDDFPHNNILNLGFGGAFISSLSQNFQRLFIFEAPKAIVLYLGGNDLSLGWTAKKIIEKIKTLIAIIHGRYPGTTIVNLSIKPSLERSNLLQKIIQINKAIFLFAEKSDFLIHVNIFDDLLKDGKANPNYFLMDGLHLNGDGYKILKNQIKNYI